MTRCRMMFRSVAGGGAAEEGSREDRGRNHTKHSIYLVWKTSNGRYNASICLGSEQETVKTSKLPSSLTHHSGANLIVRRLSTRLAGSWVGSAGTSERNPYSVTTTRDIIS